MATADGETGHHWRQSVRGRVLVSLGFALLVLIGLALFADSRKLAAALREFRWPLLVPILLLTSTNYALRFVKWQYYLRRTGITDLSSGLSLRIFFSGFVMAITPGKIGEVLKSLLLREATGVPIAVTAPIILAERLTDGIAMLFLASAGLAIFRYGVPVFVTIAVVAVCGFMVLQQQRFVRRAITAGERVRFLAGITHHLHTFYDNIHWLLRPKPLLFAAALGFVSWLMECVAFFLVLVGLGFDGTPRLLLTATFVLAAATLIGSVSFLPGGLGAAEIGMTAMLIALITTPLMTHDVAVAATLIVRFCTLWFGVGIGFIALASVRGLLSGRGHAARKTLADAVPHGDYGDGDSRPPLYPRRRAAGGVQRGRFVHGGADHTGGAANDHAAANHRSDPCPHRERDHPEPDRPERRKREQPAE